MVVLQVIIEGLATGTVYAGLALALVLVYRMTGVVNFAQGEMGMFGAFVIWWLSQNGLSNYTAMAIGLACFFSWYGRRARCHTSDCSFRRTPGCDNDGRHFSPIQRIGTLDLGNREQSVPWPVRTRRLFGRWLDCRPRHSWHDGNHDDSRRRIPSHAACDEARPRLRGAAANPISSGLVGIPVQHVIMLGWGLANVLATLAGALIAPRLMLDSNLMLGVIVYALAAAAVGGFQSIFGAIFGGLFIGVVENLAANFVGFISSDLKIIVPLAFLVLILVFRPTGLFGRPQDRMV